MQNPVPNVLTASCSGRTFFVSHKLSAKNTSSVLSGVISSAAAETEASSKHSTVLSGLSKAKSRKCMIVHSDCSGIEASVSRNGCKKARKKCKVQDGNHSIVEPLNATVVNSSGQNSSFGSSMCDKKTFKNYEDLTVNHSDVEPDDPVVGFVDKTCERRNILTDQLSRSIDVQQSDCSDVHPQKISKRNGTHFSKRGKLKHDDNENCDVELPDSRSVVNTSHRKYSIRRKWSDEELAILKRVIKRSASVPGWNEIDEAKRRHKILENRSREQMKARIVHLMNTGR